MAYVPGYSVTMRQDKRTGEYLAFIPSAYRNAHGERYYMAYTLTDGWVELSPEYATRMTRNVGDTYPERLRDCVNREMGYVLHLAPRLYA